MKHLIYLVVLGLLFASCSTTETENDSSESDSSNADALFEANSKTVMTYLQGYQDENLDYAELYSADYIMRGTGQGSSDSITAEQVMENDAAFWAKYDYELDLEAINLLPGVNQDTKLPDGSVRYYGNWTVTRSATDSTEAKSAILKIYESFDFDEDGKIVFQQYYGDFGGLKKALQSQE
jgi:hypothetical protein